MRLLRAVVLVPRWRGICGAVDLAINSHVLMQVIPNSARQLHKADSGVQKLRLGDIRDNIETMTDDVFQISSLEGRP